MATTPDHQPHQINAADARRRQLRALQVIFAGAAAIAMLARFDAARPDTTETMLASGSVRMADMAADFPTPANAPLGPQYPQTPPSLVGNGGFATDDDDDDQAQQQAQQEEQQALQQMQQAEQQAEEQNEQAQQQFTQDELQAQMTEQQANP